MNRVHRIYLDTWLINASIVGLYSILKHSKKDHLINFNTNNNYIDINDSFLDNFEEDFFNYFIDTYNDQLTYTKIIKKIDILLNSNTNEIISNIENFNEHINYIQSKVTLNSISTAINLSEIKNSIPKLKKIKISKDNNISEVKEQLRIIKNILKDSRVERFIKTENVLHLILGKFYSNVGPLNKNMSKLNKSIVFNEYFIDPAENYLGVEYRFNEETFICSTCNNHINTKRESFNLAWINGIGADVQRKTNYFHNFKRTTFICPICNLILSCLPAGFYFDLYTRKGIFINDNRSISTLIDINKGLGSNHSLYEFEKKSYEILASKIGFNSFNNANCNLQVVKLDADNKTTGYKFDLINNEFLNIIHKNKDNLSILVNHNIQVDNKLINLYQISIDYLLRYKNTFQLFDILIQQKYYNGMILGTILSLSINDANIENENNITIKLQNHGATLGKKLKTINMNKLHKLRIDTYRCLKLNNPYTLIELISFYTSYCELEMIEEVVYILDSFNLFKLYGGFFLSGLYLEKT